MLRFSLDLKQLPYPQHPQPKKQQQQQQKKHVFQLKLRCQSPQSITFAVYKVAV